MNPARIALTLAAALAVAACWELPAGDKTSPDYWSQLFLDKYADELVVGELEPGPPPLDEPRAVLLITGVTIRAAWFEPIAARLERDGFIPYIYEPPDLLTGDLLEESAALADVVAHVLAISGQQRVDILAECTGGVIARHYVQSLGGDEHVSRLVTFVAPHQGITKAPWAAAIAGWPALYDLSPGSAFLTAVNSVPVPPNVPITSIYTCSDEYILPWQGSIVPGATNIGLCDGFVGHFQTFYDPEIYEIMYDALTAPLPEGAGPIWPTEPSDAGSDGQTGSGTSSPPTPSDPEPTDPEPTEPGPDGPSAGTFTPPAPSDPEPTEPELDLGAGSAPLHLDANPAPDEVSALGCQATGGASGVLLALLGLGAVAWRRRQLAGT